MSEWGRVPSSAGLLYGDSVCPQSSQSMPPAFTLPAGAPGDSEVGMETFPHRTRPRGPGCRPCSWLMKHSVFGPRDLFMTPYFLGTEAPKVPKSRLDLCALLLVSCQGSF